MFAKLCIPDSIITWFLCQWFKNLMKHDWDKVVKPYQFEHLDYNNNEDDTSELILENRQTL